jgi:hypothetical protein
MPTVGDGRTVRARNKMAVDHSRVQSLPSSLSRACLGKNIASRFSQEEDRKVGKERKKDSRRERDFFACTPTCRDLDLSRVDATEEWRSFFWSFPYVCPEPVLVKCSFLYINGSKSPFSDLRTSSCRAALSRLDAIRTCKNKTFWLFGSTWFVMSVPSLSWSNDRC